MSRLTSLQREKEIELRDIKAEITTNKSSQAELKASALANRHNREEAQQELDALDTQEGRQMSNLEQKSKDAAKAWKWVQEHLEQFDQEVYGPPLISCSVKDPRYTAAIESMLMANDFLTFTVQNDNDLKKLSDQLYGKMQLTDISIRTANDDLESKRKEVSITKEQLRELGMDGWALDFLDGPLPVLYMLCNSQGLHQAAVTLQDISEEQYELITKGEILNKWVTATQSYKVSRRREYGPSAVSTVTRGIRPASWWVDTPVDSSVRTEIHGRLKTLEGEFTTLKSEVMPLRASLNDLEQKQRALEEEIVSV